MSAHNKMNSEMSIGFLDVRLLYCPSMGRHGIKGERNYELFLVRKEKVGET